VVLTTVREAARLVQTDRQSATRGEREARRTGQPHLVLILERDESLRRLLHRAVETEGCAALEARTALEAAVVVARSGRVVDLVITDLSQPGLAGPYGLREKLGTRTKFLYLLMSSSDARVPEEDVTFFLQNPFRGRALEEKLREIFRRR
jgi:DNA-binding response OmpR family regulator